MKKQRRDVESTQVNKQQSQQGTESGELGGKDPRRRQSRESSARNVPLLLSTSAGSVSLSVYNYRTANESSTNDRSTGSTD